MITNAYKWLLDADKVRKLTIREYSILELAMFEKRAEERALLREIRADIINFGGMGAKKMYSSKEIEPIPYLDNADLIMPIRSIEEALKLLKMFEKAQTV